MNDITFPTPKDKWRFVVWIKIIGKLYTDIPICSMCDETMDKYLKKVKQLKNRGLLSEAKLEELAYAELHCNKCGVTWLGDHPEIYPKWVKFK